MEKIFKNILVAGVISILCHVGMGQMDQNTLLLQKAVRDNDLEKVRISIENDADIYAVDHETGNTVIYEAAMTTASIRSLLRILRPINEKAKEDDRFDELYSTVNNDYDWPSSYSLLSLVQKELDSHINWRRRFGYYIAKKANEYSNVLKLGLFSTSSWAYWQGTRIPSSSNNNLDDFDDGNDDFTNLEKKHLSFQQNLKNLVYAGVAFGSGVAANPYLGALAAGAFIYDHIPEGTTQRLLNYRTTHNQVLEGTIDLTNNNQVLEENPSDTIDLPNNNLYWSIASGANEEFLDADEAREQVIRTAKYILKVLIKLQSYHGRSPERNLLNVCRLTQTTLRPIINNEIGLDRNAFGQIASIATGHPIRVISCSVGTSDTTTQSYLFGPNALVKAGIKAKIPKDNSIILIEF